MTLKKYLCSSLLLFTLFYYPTISYAQTLQNEPLRNPFLPTFAKQSSNLPNETPLNTTLSHSSLTRNFNISQYKLNFVPALEIKDTLQNICFSGKLSIDGLSNSIFFSGPLEETQYLKKVLSAIDQPTCQITLEAKVISLSNDASKNLGVNWHWEPIPQYKSEDSNSNNTSGNFRFYRSNSLRFGTTINALISKGKAKIIASPHIVTLPGKQGHIFIGDHIPYQIDKHDSGGTYTSTEYIDAGISLKYTPIINSDANMITASVQAEVSTPTLVSELKNYKVTSRKVDTSVRMHSGETLVIGGLITQEEQKTLQKIPFLGDIPLLGNFFKNRTNTNNKTEILLLLTPYISKPGTSPAIYNAEALRLEKFNLNKEILK